MHHWLDLKLTPQHTLLSSRPSSSIIMKSSCIPHMLIRSWTSALGWLHQIIIVAHWCQQSPPIWWRQTMVCWVVYFKPITTELNSSRLAIDNKNKFSKQFSVNWSNYNKIDFMYSHAQTNFDQQNMSDLISRINNTLSKHN